MSVARASEKTSLGWMPFYFERFAWSTRGWSSESAYAYLMLLCEQWNAGFIDPDPEKLDGLVRGVKSSWVVIEPKFPIGDDGKRRNPMCEKLRAEALAVSQRRIASARNASRIRWESESNPNRIRIESESKPIDIDIDIDKNKNIKHTLIGRADEPVLILKKKEKIDPSKIEALWLAFPRKVGKGKAFDCIPDAIKKIRLEMELDSDEDAIEFLREKILDFAKKSKETEEKFIAHPATWLRQGRFLD